MTERLERAIDRSPLGAERGIGLLPFAFIALPCEDGAGSAAVLREPHVSGRNTRARRVAPMIVTERPPCDAAIVRSAPETPGCASHARRWVLKATILGSSVAFMMASIINVALPAIQETYRATVSQMQWIATAYTVLLAALTLTGGAVGDRFGRRRVFQTGLAGVALASLAGSLAPNAPGLIAARAAQGLAAALLVPNSLALLSAAFPRAERGAAIGSRAAATPPVRALSPRVGGRLVDAGSWRLGLGAIGPAAIAR